MLMVLALSELLQLELLEHGEIVYRCPHCPSATAYEEEGATTVNDGSTAVGDTTITVADGTTLKCWRYYSFFNNGGYK